jgi:hypothetical protein
MAMLAVAPRIKLTVWPWGWRRAGAISCGPSAYVRARCGSGPFLIRSRRSVSMTSARSIWSQMTPKFSSCRTGVGAAAGAVPQEAGGLWLVGVGVAGAGRGSAAGALECLADRADANEAGQAAGEAV